MKDNDGLHHVATLIATVAGILGFGLIYNGVTFASSAELLSGASLLLPALWWVGRDLARSNLASRRRKMLEAMSYRTRDREP